jgi:predicted nuclease of predicted toxin-antitoxin system
LKILFDEDLQGRLARSLPQHEIHTVVTMEWGGIKNGALLKLIEGEGFHVFLTGDQNMQNQQQFEGRPFAVLVMSAINWPVILPHVSKISDAIDATEPDTLKAIDCGVFIPKQRRTSE